MKRQRGFSIIELLLIFVIIVLVGGTGWYVWHAKNNANKTLDKANQSSNSSAKYSKKSGSNTATQTRAQTADWVAYSSTEGQYSLKYPRTWTIMTSPELCNPGLLLLGGNSQSVGKCATESFGQIAISSMSGDYRSDNGLTTGYTGVTNTTVTVNGVTGQKAVGTAQGQSNEAGIGVLPDGTKVVKYVFYTNGRTYVGTYVKLSAYPDVLSNFDLMMTETFTFHS